MENSTDEIRYFLSVPFYQQYQIDEVEIGQTVAFINNQGIFHIGEIVNIKGNDFITPKGKRMMGLVIKYKKLKHHINYSYCESSLDYLIKVGSKIKPMTVRYESVENEFPLRT